MRGDVEAQLCQMNTEESCTTVLKERPSLNPAGFILLTDVCDLKKKKNLEWRKIILIQNDVFSCLAQHGNYVRAQFPGDKKEKPTGQQERQMQQLLDFETRVTTMPSGLRY